MILVNAIVFLFCVTQVAPSDFNIFKNVWYSEEQFDNLYNHFSIDKTKLSEKCWKGYFQYKTDLSLGKRWALEMFDAASKIPTGILSGSAGDLGNFDQCLNVAGETSEGIIRGKYCIGKLLINTTKSYGNMETLNRISLIDMSYISLATCLPDSCSATDIETIYRNLIRVSGDSCQTAESQPNLDAIAITTISILGVVATIMISSTIYDMYNYYTKRKPYHNILIAFSAFTNGRKLLTVNNSPDQISCLHGIRTITMMWIILSHKFTLLSEVLILNGKEALEWLHEFKNSYIIGATLTVDSFLFLSGLVISYNFMCIMKKGHKFNIFSYYLHRYLRLTPGYAVLILVNVSLMKHFGSGPQWPGLVKTVLEEPCRKYWWSALLYVQNYVNPQQPCIVQSWYLSVDTQLFLLSPLLLLPFLKWPRIKPFALLALIIGAALTTFFVCWFEELYGFIVLNEPERQMDYVNKVYYPTHTRASPWIIGFATGYIIHATKKKNFVRKFSIPHNLISGILWIVSVSILLTCLYGVYDVLNRKFSLIANTTYTAFTPPAWSVALACVILLCVHGYGGPINWLLSNALMQVMSKFTYSMYLLHKMVISIYLYSSRTPVIFGNSEVWHSFWGDFMFTFVLAVFWVLAFESPIVAIEKLVFGRGKEKQQPSSQPTGDSEQTIKRII